MAIQTPSCSDSEWQLLFKILQSLPDISTGGGGSAIIVQDEGVQLTAALAQLNFVGAGVTATAVGNDVTVTVPGSSAGTLQSGAQAIAAGGFVVTVVFPVAFVGVPKVVCTMSRPSGSALIQLNINSETILATGFTARLSAMTPDATYILQWMAHL